VAKRTRFRRDRNEGLLPSRPESADDDPEEFVEQVSLGADVDVQDGELLT